MGNPQDTCPGGFLLYSGLVSGVLMSRVVSPASIIRYTECPKKLLFSQEVEGPIERVNSISGQIVRSVVKDVYLRTARKGQIPGWQFVIGQTDRAYRKAV